MFQVVAARYESGYLVRYADDFICAFELEPTPAGSWPCCGNDGPVLVGPVSRTTAATAAHAVQAEVENGEE